MSNLQPFVQASARKRTNNRNRNRQTLATPIRQQLMVFPVTDLDDNTDEQSLDANSIVDDAPEIATLDKTLAGLTTFAIMDVDKCRVKFHAKGYICGGTYGKCKRPGHNTVPEADRHPPVAALQVRVRSTSLKTDGDGSHTIFLANFEAMSLERAAVKSQRLGEIRASPSFRNSNGQDTSSVSPTLGVARAPTELATDDDDDDDDSYGGPERSLAEVTQQADQLFKLVETEKRSALDTPPIRNTANGRLKREPDSKPGVAHDKLDAYMAVQMESNKQMMQMMQLMVSMTANRETESHSPPQPIAFTYWRRRTLICETPASESITTRLWRRYAWNTVSPSYTIWRPRRHRRRALQRRRPPAQRPPAHRALNALGAQASTAAAKQRVPLATPPYPSSVPRTSNWLREWKSAVATLAEWGRRSSRSTLRRVRKIEREQKREKRRRNQELISSSCGSYELNPEDLRLPVPEA
jgi:hypothetical protein